MLVCVGAGGLAGSGDGDGDDRSLSRLYNGKVQSTRHTIRKGNMS